jgi:hypothetical protein
MRKRAATPAGTGGESFPLAPPLNLPGRDAINFD